MRLIALLMLIPFLAYGEVKSKIGADTITVGVPSSGSDITWKYQDTNMATRANKTTGKLQFTNDSVAWKDFGSGEGSGSSGVNIAPNNSFEDNVTVGWTSSGGTFTQQTYTNNDGINTKYARFVATATSQYFRTNAMIIPTSLTGACVAYLGKYKTNNNGVFTARILDASFNVLASSVIATTNDLWSQGDVSSVIIPFACPVAGATRYFDVISNAAGTIEVDLVKYGSDDRQVRIQPNGLVLEAYYDGVASCSVSASSSSAWADFGTSATCPGLTVNYSAGGVSANTADIDRIDRITVNNLKAGRYKVSLQTHYNNSTNTNYSSIRITDGTQNGIGSGSAVSGTDNSSHYAYFNYSSDQSSVTFKAQCYSVSPSTGCVMFNNAPASSQSKWIIERVDSNADLAISQSQSEWMIDANIRGGNWATPNSAVTTYSPIESGVWTIYPNDGSSPVEIACSSTNPSTGSTCSVGNESLSVAFNPPHSGRFEICGEFSYWVGASTSDQNIAAQWVETPNNSQTILKEGNTRKQFGGNSANAGDTNFYPVSICGIFTFNDTSKKTLRLFYEKPNAGSGNGAILADANASAGQQDIHIVVKPLKAGVQLMKTGDTLTTPDASDPVLCSAFVSSAGVLSNQDGGCFSSCNNATTPVCTFTTNYWPAGYIPKCWVSSRSAAANVNGGDAGTGTTNTTYAGTIYNGSISAAAGDRTYYCHGRRK